MELIDSIQSFKHDPEQKWNDIQNSFSKIDAELTDAIYEPSIFDKISLDVISIIMTLLPILQRTKIAVVCKAFNEAKKLIKQNSIKIIWTSPHSTNKTKVELLEGKTRKKRPNYRKKEGNGEEVRDGGRRRRRRKRRSRKRRT